MLLEQYEFPLLIFVVLTTLFLGSIVLYRDKSSRSNSLFFLLCLSFAVWAVVNYFSIHPPFGSKLTWIRLVLFSAAPQAVIFAFFVHTFPNKEIVLKRKIFCICLFILMLQMVLALTPLVFKSTISVGNKIIPQPGPGIAFYALAVTIFFGAGIYLMIKRSFSFKGEERKSMLFLLAGFSVTACLLLIFLLFAVVVIKNTSFIPFSPVFVLPFIISTGYALVKQKFLNIRLIATEFLAGILTIALLTEALVSDDWFGILWKLFFSFVIGFLGFLLIQSVHGEIRRREEVGHLARSLEHANMRLQKLDQQKTEFLSIASHQLRTPLTVMKGYSELIKDGAYGKPTKGITEVVSNMEESNEHLAKLVDEFLDISRIEQGRTKYNFKIVNLSKMVEDIEAELKERSDEKKLKLIIKKTGRGSCKVEADEEKIRHVVYNFIDNAIKYTNKGAVTVSAQSDEGGVTVRVQDNGIGFGKVDEANFFQKFYRGENVKGENVTGTGLGLYVCKKFIEAHGGRIWGKSIGLGQGSEFGFWVPEKRQG